MRLLKKASINDIISNKITTHYKEIELFTTWEDIKTYIEDDKLNLLINELNKNKAIISAIHCPKSFNKTSSDIHSNYSTNYLSICEVIKDKASLDGFKEIIEFSEKIYRRQWNICETNESVNDVDDENINSSQANHDKIILIIHSGCENGCQDNYKNIMNDCNIPQQNDLQKNFFENEYVEFAIENITPYIDENNKLVPKGKNCGWSNEQKWNAFTIAKKLKVGVCLDICHIFASKYIMSGNTNIQSSINDYLQYIKKNKFESLISIFHLSNYDKNGLHGVQFEDNNEDNALIEQIRAFCYEIAPNALITLEVADGQDYKKGCRNFNKLMLKLSEQHTSGILQDLMDDDLKKFFEDLYYVYALDGNNIFDLRERALCIKKYVLSNTYIDLEKKQINIPFNFTWNSEKFDTAIFRIQAYIYYTRFCNLAMFLAKNYYNDKSIIDEKNKQKDFTLALKYFMFNDDVKQIEYTGIGFRFNVNWLPRKDTIFRFYDGIDKVNTDWLKNVSSQEIIEKIINEIRLHVGGGNGYWKMYSCGRNFGTCLFKYCQPISNNNNWTVRVYENIPINFIEYKNQKYSIPAFMQEVGMTKKVLINISDFCFDMSEFSEGRGDERDAKEKNASSLFSIFRYYTNNISIVEKTGSIIDGEILFLNLPKECLEYSFTSFDIIVLFELYFKFFTSRKKFEKEDVNKIISKLETWLSEHSEELGKRNIKSNDNSNNICELLHKVSLKESNTKDELMNSQPYSESTTGDIKNLFKFIENYNL